MSLRPWEYKEGDRVKVSVRVSMEDTAEPVNGTVLVVDPVNESYILIGAFDDGRPAKDVHFTRVEPLVDAAGNRLVNPQFVNEEGQTP